MNRTQPLRPRSHRRRVRPAAVAALAALAVALTAALSFVTLQLPRWLTGVADRWVSIPDLHPAIDPGAVDEFVASHRTVGFASLALVLALIAAGMVARRRSASATGAVLLFLPTFGHFAGYMFFLAGLGVLRVLWLPMWSSRLMALGDVAYVPYMATVWPLWLLGIDARRAVAIGAIVLGLLVFAVSVSSWLVERAAGAELATSWVYRHSRHPQYLGWILWSWGVMLLAAQAPIPYAGENPGAALPWVMSTLAIVCVAWAEEGSMERAHPDAYPAYRRRTPFILPIPRTLGRALAMPFRLVAVRDRPQRTWDPVIAFCIYLILVAAASLPFALLGWPAPGWWAWPGVHP